MLICSQFPVRLLIVVWEPVDDNPVSQDLATRTQLLADVFVLLA